MFICLGFITYKSLNYYRSNRYFTVDLPNKINFSFNFVAFLQVYLVLLPLGKLNPIEKNCEIVCI